MRYRVRRRPIFARRHSRLTCCTRKSLHDDGRRETTGWPLCPSFQRLRSVWNRMEPFSGIHRMWSPVGTSNADQNWHETLVKVGRIVPWTSCWTSPVWSYSRHLLVFQLAFVDVRDSQAQISSSPDYCSVLAGSDPKSTGTLAAVIVSRTTRKPVRVPIDFGDKGGADCTLSHLTGSVHYCGRTLVTLPSPGSVRGAAQPTMHALTDVVFTGSRLAVLWPCRNLRSEDKMLRYLALNHKHCKRLLP